MRFIHTSDWHLGRIFYNIHLTDDQHYVLEQLIALTREIKPQAVIVAGDVYDRAVPPAEAVQLLNEVITRLVVDCRTSVLLIAGNHDSPERLEFGNRIFARQKVFLAGKFTGALQPVILEDKYGPVYFFLLPYLESASVREQLEDETLNCQERVLDAAVAICCQKIPPGTRAVAVAHAWVEGGTKSESERPLALGGLETVPAHIFAPFAYTALGHLHKPQQLAGNSPLCYPGSLLKYSFSEVNQHKGVLVVELDGRGEVQIEPVHLTPRREVRCIEGYMEEILKGPSTGKNREDYLKIILKDREPIFDAINKLRRIYPHVLEIERAPEAERDVSPQPGNSFDHRFTGEEDLFKAFFREVTGKEADTEEITAFRAVVTEIRRQEREGET